MPILETDSARPQDELQALCRLARERFGPSCFWWLSDKQPAADAWKAIVKGLRTYGGHAGMALAHEIQEAARAVDRLPD